MIKDVKVFLIEDNADWEITIALSVDYSYVILNDRECDPGLVKNNLTYIFRDLSFENFTTKNDLVSSTTLALLKVDYSPELQCLVIVKAARDIDERFRPVIEHLHHKTLDKLNFGCLELKFEVEISEKN